jgi:prepilin-type N-terminal cleavage/methylation domain-containing protein
MFQRGFTLIELLIVVAIIAILAAIAVPNFLEAQTRSKVSRVKADFRALATAVESYRVDHTAYPEGTDNPNNYPQEIATFFGPRAGGYYAFRTRGANGVQVGRDFAGITTPIAYTTSIPTDPFAKQAAGFLTYCYRNAKIGKNGWILTSFGPDADVLEDRGRLGVGTDNPNQFSTFSDTKTPARLGDVNEVAVTAIFDGTSTVAVGSLQSNLQDLSYDPTNGTISDGDIIYVSGYGLIN